MSNDLAVLLAEIVTVEPSRAVSIHVSTMGLPTSETLPPVMRLITPRSVQPPAAAFAHADTADKRTLKCHTAFAGSVSRAPDPSKNIADGLLALPAVTVRIKTLIVCASPFWRKRPAA
jgi:hypothetical protein